jgi:hypothetical protein
MRKERVLTITEVSDEMLARCGLKRGGATSSHCQCLEFDELVPIAKVIGPWHRMLNVDATVSLLEGFRDGHSIPPVEIFHETEPDGYHLLDSCHRWRVSLAVGYQQLPATLVDRDWAETCRGYARPPKR